MKYIKHIILTAFAMVVMMGAWAQTTPTKQSNGTWQFTMPDANKLLEVEYYPCTLTVAKVGAGSVALAPTSYTLTFSGTNDNSIVVNNYDGTSFSSLTLSKTVEYMLADLYGDIIDVINETVSSNSNRVNVTDQVDVFHSYIVVTGTFDNEETITFTRTSDNTSHTIKVSCTPNMTGIVADANNSNNNSNIYYIMPGTEITVTATADEHYHFDYWTNEYENVIDGGATKTFTVAGDTTLTATFAIDTVRLDSVRLTWQVQIGNAAAISPTPYVTVNPTAADTMGYVLIPKNAAVVITPSTEQKELVSKLDLIPIGAINGKFSVGSNKQVYFSKGNLQYTKSTNVWSFMEHQYSMVETADQNVGANYANQNVVSLFGWGTSGYNHGATCYQPNCTNKYPVNYYAYGDAQKSLFDESGKADWGYNAISNGGNTENSGWRTLTNKEWVWLLGPTYANSSPTPGTNCRTSSTISGTPNARFAKANLFGTTHGLIIFPDNYTHPEGVDAPTGINMTDSTSWNANTYTSADWAKMEAAGAVFLPAAGRRPTNDGSSTHAYTVKYVGNTGCYWSSTDSTNDAQQVLFGYGNHFIVDGGARRSDGHSVRLVKMATESASAQTDPYVPARNSDNSWTFKMPTSDLMLRTTWKQYAGLAYAKADTTVYRGLTSTVQNPLTKPNSISSVTYSITPKSGTTTNNVINPSTGEVTIHGTGIDTVKARFAGNNDYLPDSAMYILRTLEPWKLTLATVGDGTVVVPPSYTLTFSGTDNNYNPIVVNNYDGTSFSTSTLGNSGMGVSAMLSALYGSNSIDPASCTPTEHVSTSTPWIVVTGTFSTAETMIFTDNNSNNRTITVSCTPNMNGIDVDPNNSNKYYVVPGTEVTVKATANEHYHFTKWTSGSTEMALTETMSFTVTSDTTVTANFAGNVYTVTANTNGNGSVTGGGSITYPNSATLVATANEHYHFVNWTSPSNVVLGTETTLVVQPTSDSTVNANFAIDTFELSFGPLASSQEAIDAHGSVAFYSASTIVEQVDDDTYKVPYGTKVTLKATPDADYHLRSWTYSNSSMTHVEDFEQDTTTITVTGAQTVTGNFAIDTVRLDSVRTTWYVYINGATTAIHSIAYSANDTMGYVKIPIDADVVITPSAEQKELVSKLELIDKSAPVVPEGAINGLFSVSATKQVYFSQGNLQYDNGGWQFATNQYDIFDGQTDGIRDLFGWGTGSDPENLSTDANNYYWKEWGENAITNGGNTVNSGWRTLTSAEWWYLFFTRTTTSGVRYAKALVADKPGVILLPDDWSTSYYNLENTNIDNAAFASNVINASTWSSSLEAHGAVFLPAASYRNGNVVSNVGVYDYSYGYYWSSTPDGDTNAKFVTFGDTSSLYAESSSSRHYGYSVRLVKDAN